ncbi:MAG TPA: DUF488 domain-containing protein [Gemmatimonadaceae bacterium]|jgi:uncharacterized protein (DUF488 family)|nr:DUF488 domain-containing protein [Gemmatimonadaceae bacterium]
MTIWTIGHSTRAIEAFVEVLRGHGIETVVDVRRFPGSRRLPQFGTAALEASLRAVGLSYRWIGALGGRRRPDPASPNDAWENDAFRGYADHTATEEFADGLFELLMVASGLRTAIMCAEQLWWRCHRRIIADVLVSLGYDVQHIRDASTAEPHVLAPPARMVDHVLTYESPAVQLDLYPIEPNPSS